MINYACPKATQLYVTPLDNPIVPLVPRAKVPSLTELAVDDDTAHVFI